MIFVFRLAIPLSGFSTMYRLPSANATRRYAQPSAGCQSNFELPASRMLKARIYIEIDDAADVLLQVLAVAGKKQISSRHSNHLCLQYVSLRDGPTITSLLILSASP
ncbi:unnamed protein product [Cercospora beticola]|nr:unnamed protein product [Cercospora beticola]